MQKEISPKIVALTFGILVITFLVAFYVIAWQEPTQAPPGGNVPTPLNVGKIGQSKEGGLILNTGNATTGLIVGGAEYGLIVDRGKVCIGTDCRDKWPETGLVTTYKMEASGYKAFNSAKGYDEYFSKTVSYDCPQGSDVVNIACTQNMVGTRGYICTEDPCPIPVNKNSCSCSGSENHATLTASVVVVEEDAFGYCATIACTGYQLTNYCYPHTIPLYHGYWCYIPSGTPQCAMEFQCGTKQTVGE